MLKIFDGRDYFFQWDTNRKLIVEADCQQVHFRDSDGQTSFDCLVREEDGVRVCDVPNIVLQRPAAVTAWVYVLADGNLSTERTIIPVIPRQKPAGYVYTPTEVLNYETLADRMTEYEGNPPRVNELDHWEIYSIADHAYIDTGINARGVSGASAVEDSTEEDGYLAVLDAQGHEPPVTARLRRKGLIDSHGHAVSFAADWDGIEDKPFASVGAGLAVSAAGVLSVDVEDTVTAGVTKPVTSNAVSNTVGNINALLATI